MVLRLHVFHGVANLRASLATDLTPIIFFNTLAAGLPVVTQGGSDAELQFMRLVCRVGSMGWDSHEYMTLVHSESHLSGQFNKDNIEAKQQSFRQHLCLNIFGASFGNRV
jgi:hypothetical protein